jgi:hypothetical protein
MTIKARRAGQTSRYWSGDVYDETLTSATDEISFKLKMPSKGGGITEVQLQVSKESFESVARAMVKANDGVAALAFVNTEIFGQIVSAMIEADEDKAIASFAVALRTRCNSDGVIKACADILYDISDSRVQTPSVSETVANPLALAVA